MAGALPQHRPHRTIECEKEADRNMSDITGDTMGMFSRLVSTLLLAAAVVAGTAGCGSDEPERAAKTVTVTADPTAAAQDAGRQVADLGDAMAILINKGCGHPGQPNCAESGDQVKVYAQDMRDLMVQTGRVEYYSEGKAIIDRLLSAPTSPALRSAAIDLLTWLEMHPA